MNSDIAAFDLGVMGPNILQRVTGYQQPIMRIANLNDATVYIEEGLLP